MSKLRSVLFYAELGSSKTNIALNTHFFKLTADSLGRGLFLNVNKRAYLLAVPYLCKFTPSSVFREEKAMETLPFSVYLAAFSKRFIIT